MPSATPDPHVVAAFQARRFGHNRPGALARVPGDHRELELARAAAQRRALRAQPPGELAA